MPALNKTREATKQETRDALIGAGLAAFAEEGLDLPSLDAICARAGFTRGAFYVHFRDRDDFLVAVMEQVFGILLDAVIATGDDAHDLEHTVDRFAAVVALAPQGSGSEGVGIALHRVLDACARAPGLRQRFVTLLQDGAVRLTAAARHGQAAGTVRGDVEPKAMGLLLIFMALGAMAALDAGVPFDPSTARDAALRLLQPTRTRGVRRTRP